MTVDGLLISLRVVVGLSSLSALVWACELGDETPTQVPLAQAEAVVQQAYCDRMFACTCDRGRYFDERDDCEATVTSRIDDLRARAEFTGLTYDPSCLGAFVDQLDALGCAATVPDDDDDDDDDDCEPRCTVLHGDVPLGGACVDWEGDSDCAAGLSCAVTECAPNGNPQQCQGTCVDPCDGACPGGCDDDERCDGNTAECVALPRLGEDCENAERCAPGLFCRYQESPDPLEFTATCQRLPAEGDSCTDSGVCDQGLRCEFDPVDGSGVCVGPTADGEPCTGHGECDSGYCPAGRCAALPAKGDSCAGTFACAPGLDCDPDSQTCVEGDAVVCNVYFPSP